MIGAASWQSLPVLGVLTPLSCACAQLLMLTSSTAIMGACFVNSRVMRGAAWAIAAAIMGVNGTLLWELLAKELPRHWAARTGFLAVVALYLCLVLYFAIGPQRCAPPGGCLIWLACGAWLSKRPHVAPRAAKGGAC